MYDDLLKLGKSEGEYQFERTGSVTIEVYDDIKKIVVNLNNTVGVTPNAVISMLLENEQLKEYEIQINAYILI